MKRKLSFIALAALILAGITPALSSQAALFLGDELSLVDRPAQQDVYAVGEQVAVREKVTGDVVTAAGIVNIEAEVTQDITALGGTISLQNKVGDDVRLGGETVTVRGNVGGDLFAAGATIHIGKDVTIEGGAFLAGGIIVIDGTIKGDLRVSGGQIMVNGSVGGTTWLNAEKINISGTLTGESTLQAFDLAMTDTARFESNVRYWTETGPTDFGARLVNNAQASYDDALSLTRPGDASSFLKLSLGWLIFSLLSAALVLLLFVLFDNKLVFETTARTLSRSFWKSFLVGLVFIIVTPIAAVVLMITVIGIPVGLFLLVMYFFSMYAASIIAALTLAKWVDLRKKEAWGKPMLFLVALGFLVVLRALFLVPILGMLVGLATVPATFGALLIAKFGRQQKK
jgi:hypothetical protein